MLASPFVGVSNDGLVLIRRHTRPAPAVHRASSARCPRRSRRRTSGSCARSSSGTSGSSPRPRGSRSSGCASEIVAAHDYDLAVLARWDGKRRYANLRKLMRLARSYEELRGPDIEGFVAFLRDQEALGAAQLEAVSEEEGAGAVRLLTIHAAKGLEFKVVIVADAGRDTGGAPSADEILVRADGSLRLPGDRSGVGQARAASSTTRRCAPPSRPRTTAERLRLYYVAMTRAVDRLIVSGRDRPRAARDRNTPIGWVLERLDASAEVETRRRQPFELERGAARFLVACRSLAGRSADVVERGRRRRCGPACVVRGAADDAAAPRLPAAGARAAARPAAASRAPAVVLGARAVRALLVPLLRRARRRPARGARHGARCGRRARRDGDRRRRAPAAGDSTCVRATSRSCASGIRA